MKAPVIITAIVLLLFWGCSVNLAGYNSKYLVKLDDKYCLRETMSGDTVLAYERRVWETGDPVIPYDTMWVGGNINLKQIIVYPNQYILVKNADGYIAIGYKDGYAEYYNHSKSKRKFIDYANKIGAPLYGTENW